jgi:hypothetical protein
MICQGEVKSEDLPQLIHQVIYIFLIFNLLFF